MWFWETLDSFYIRINKLKSARCAGTAGEEREILNHLRDSERLAAAVSMLRSVNVTKVAGDLEN